MRQNCWSFFLVIKCHNINDGYFLHENMFILNNEKDNIKNSPTKSLEIKITFETIRCPPYCLNMAFNRITHQKIVWHIQ